jgi:antitoxin component of MazEF toxin-antitoxin module
MERKLVKIGRSLAVTLPSEVVKEFKLKKGQGVELSVHPATGAVTVRPGVKFFEDGKASKRFRKIAEEVRQDYDRAFKKLAE